MANTQVLLAAFIACILACAVVCAQDITVDVFGDDGVVATLSTDYVDAPTPETNADSVTSVDPTTDYSTNDASTGQDVQSVVESTASSTSTKQRRPAVSKGLARKMAASKADVTVPVLLSFSEDVDVQSLRKLAPGCTADQLSDPACQAAMAEAEATSEAIARQRTQKVRRFFRKLGINVLPRNIVGGFAMFNGFLVRLTPSQISAMQDAVAAGTVAEQDGDYMRLIAMEDPNEPLVAQQSSSGSCTNTDTFSFTDPIAIRTATTADAFFSNASDPVANGLRIALIDQGINRNHIMLRGRTGMWGDCGTTSNTCTGSTCTGNCCRRVMATNAPVDTCPSYGTPDGGTGTPAAHGTACASMLSGGTACTDNYRGASNFVVDFFRAMTVVDIVNAFQAAVRSGARVISTSLGVNSSMEAGSAVSLAADSAYDAGVIVFAAAGNFGCSTTVNGGCTSNWGYSSTGTCAAPLAGSVMAPANAHRVVAVGAFSTGAARTTAAMRSAAPMCYSARGPTRNGRVKPDILAPTGVEAAYTGSSTTSVAYFSGTSAATPNAAGAFASFMAYRMANRGASGTMPTRGEFMASIIAAGENYGTPNNNVGAGVYRPGLLGDSSVGNMGKNVWATTTFTLAGQTATIANLNVTDTTRAIKCAAWWPASATTMGNNIDLFLQGPTGTVVASSQQTTSVWEKVALTSTAVTGAYTLQIRAAAITSAQQVHAFCFY